MSRGVLGERRMMLCRLGHRHLRWAYGTTCAARSSSGHGSRAGTTELHFALLVWMSVGQVYVVFGAEGR